jgi:TRAP-type C4-dicarboxylate transport system permease small subunit
MLMLLAWVVRLADELDPEDVKAGWVAFAVVIGLIVAFVVLARSLVKQLRKAQSAKDAGVYGDEPVDREE